jgi:tetratricopeptide (TPR) repeat protein
MRPATAGTWRRCTRCRVSCSRSRGRYEDATGALRNAERLASALGADDVLALAYVNQAAVAQLRRRYDQAVALAERAVALHESSDQPHRLAASLATLGQINVKLGQLTAAETALRRALQISAQTSACARTRSRAPSTTRSRRSRSCAATTRRRPNT